MRPSASGRHPDCVPDGFRRRHHVVKIRFACYKFAPSLVSAGIRWWSHSLYSHVAIIVEQEGQFPALFEALEQGFVKSQMQDLGRLLKLHHAEPGVVVDLFDYVAPPDAAIVAHILDRTVGQKYDYAGIASFVTGGAIPENPARVFCSEIAGEASRLGGAPLQNCPSKNLMPRDVAMSLALSYTESIELDRVCVT